MTINPIGRIDAEHKAVTYEELVKIEGSSGFRKFCYLVKNWGQGKGFLTEEKRQKVYDNIRENMDTNTYSQFINAQSHIMSEGVIKAVKKMGNIQVTPPEQATPDKPRKELNIQAFNRLLSDPNFPTLMNKIAAQILPEVEVGPVTIPAQMDNWANFRPKLEQAIRENPEQVKEGVNDFLKQFPDYKNILNF